MHDLSQLPNIRVRGLMTVAPFVENPEENRVYFRKMRELLVDMNGKKIDNINTSGIIPNSSMYDLYYLI